MGESAAQNMREPMLRLAWSLPQESGEVTWCHKQPDGGPFDKGMAPT